MVHALEVLPGGCAGPPATGKESVTAIAEHLGVGRSTLYRTLAAYDEAMATNDTARDPRDRPA
ncbi:helix-turn-helix domain-containing protein [Streptomyces sp. NPDC018019]|uniref:helix-turn-helix domain-containing protein n=1 Tax=Streptomyces sp. NPDC018019 TaxID=3365030 RepID=UPI00378F7C0D